MLVSQLCDVFEIHALIFLADLIADHMISLAGKIELVTVGEVSAMSQIEAHDGVAGLKNRRERCLIRLRTGVGLHVDVFSAKKFFRAVTGDFFDLIDVFTTAVIALAGITFGVFIGEDASRGFEDGFGRKVFTGDQLDLAILAIGFFLN